MERGDIRETLAEQEGYADIRFFTILFWFGLSIIDLSYPTKL